MKTISSKEIRSKKMQYINVMQEVKPLKLLPVLDVATLAMVAEYFEMDISIVSNYYNCHKNELEEYGSIKLKAKDFQNAGYNIEYYNDGNYHIVNYGDVSVKIAVCGARCMSEAAIFNMALGIGKSEIAEKIKAAAALAETEAKGSSKEVSEDTTENATNDNVENLAEDILTFTNAEFGSIRVAEHDGQPWFVGRDVAKVLGYAKPENALGIHVDQEDKTSTLIQGTGSNYKSKAVLINESGLYSLIMSSKLPTAKQFKRWVTADVLPSIRKNGGYIAGQNDLTEEELMAKALLVAHKALEDRDKRINELNQVNKALSEKINTWDRKSVINALIRSYAGRCFGGDFKNAFADFYRQFCYKYHVNLKNRRDNSGNNKSLMDYMTEDEMDSAMKLAVAICESRDINTGKIINEINAAACCG